MEHRDRVIVNIRPAQESDTAGVLELTRTIWGGEDYVPYVWEGWLKDPQGALVVAELDGRVVGLGKLSYHGHGEWWLEGLRAHPELEGRGIAHQLHNHLLSLWLSQGDGHLRLATASMRFPVHRLCERTGFTKIGDFIPYAAAPLDEPVLALQPVQPEEASTALALALNSQVLSLCWGLVDATWSWEPLHLDHIETHARSGNAYWWTKGEGDLPPGLFICSNEQESDQDPPIAAVRLAACQLADLAALLLDFRRLAAQQGYPRAEWMAPNQPGVLPVLEAAGFERTWEHSVFVFSKEHP